MLSAIYVECHLCRVSFMLSVVLLSAIVLCVVAPASQHAALSHHC